MIKATAAVQAPPVALAALIAHRLPTLWPAWRDALQRVEQSLGGDVVVTSWWRDSAHNAAVGGDAHSQHLLGTAFDVVGPNPAEIARAFASAGFVVIPEADHVHVQAWPAGFAERVGLFSAPW